MNRLCELGFRMEGALLEFDNPIQDAISKVRFAPESNNLLVSSWDTKLRLYDVDNFKLILEAPGEAPLLDCCFQNESVAFVSGSDGYLIRYDLHSGTNGPVGNHGDLATCIDYCDNLSQIISAGWDKKIVTWDVHMRKPSGCLNTSAEVDSMSIRDFSLMVAVGASVNTYDLRKLGKSVHPIESCMNFQIKCVRPIFKTEGFVAGSIDGLVALTYLNPSDSNNEGCRYIFRCHPKGVDGRVYFVEVNDIAFNPCIPGVFVTGDSNGYLATWNARSKRRISELPRHSNSVASLSYNNDGQLLAVASSYTYQEANQMVDPPQIFVHKMGNYHDRLGFLVRSSAGSERS